MSYRSEEAVVHVVVLVASATARKSLGGQGTVGVDGAVRQTTGAVAAQGLAGRTQGQVQQQQQQQQQHQSMQVQAQVQTL